MSAYSFINHRMFVAALSHDGAAAVTSRDSVARDPVRVAMKETVPPSLAGQRAAVVTAGVLLGNALLHRYQPRGS